MKARRMTSILILSHGRLASELLEAARTIAGETPPWMEAVCLDWDATFEEAREITAAKIRSMDTTDGLVILTDMYGGTPFNVAASFTESPAVEVLAGVNLPMVVRLTCLGRAEMSPAELIPWLVEKGKRSICSCHGDIRRDECSTAGDSSRGRE